MAEKGGGNLEGLRRV